jgi:hypothetical protein
VKTCGSRLACEEIDAVYQVHRIRPFAGKPATENL